MASNKEKVNVALRGYATELKKSRGLVVGESIIKFNNTTYFVDGLTLMAKANGDKTSVIEVMLSCSKLRAKKGTCLVGGRSVPADAAWEVVGFLSMEGEAVFYGKD